MPETTHWYHAKKTDYGWKAQVYHYDETGNQQITDYLSVVTYDTESKAIDAAMEWAEDHDIEANLD